MFFLVVFFELLIVIAIFGVVIAGIFKDYPKAVIPIWLQIPIAMAIGWAIYRKNANLTLATVAGVVAMYAMVFVGNWWPLQMPDMVAGVLPATSMWVLIVVNAAILLLAIALITETLVTLLRRPSLQANSPDEA